MLIGCELRDLDAELAVPGAHDPAVTLNAEALGDGLLLAELGLQRRLFLFEMCVDRKLELDEQRCDQQDAGAMIGRQPAGDLERASRRFRLEQWDDQRFA